jgi:hypothetical protein
VYVCVCLPACLSACVPVVRDVRFWNLRASPGRGAISIRRLKTHRTANQHPEHPNTPTHQQKKKANNNQHNNDPNQSKQVKDIKPLMKENLVRLLQTDDSRVNIKARTHENVDSVGESRSWVVHVVILLEKV